MAQPQQIISPSIAEESISVVGTMRGFGSGDCFQGIAESFHFVSDGMIREYRVCSHLSWKHKIMNRLQIEEIFVAAAALRNAVGAGWLDKKVKKAKEIQKNNEAKVWNRKHLYLFSKQNHPLVDWWIALIRWKDESIATGVARSEDTPLRVHALGDSILRTKSFPGFERVVKKLRDPALFHSSAFEIEVASAYERAGSKVEFIAEEPQKKTPDLRVKFPDGSLLWVECKNREIESEKAVESQNIGKEVHKRVISILGPAKANCAISVVVKQDIYWSDVGTIVESILRLSSEIMEGNRNLAGTIETISNESSDRFNIKIGKLDGKDCARIVSSISIECDLGTALSVGYDATPLENGMIEIMNPYSFSYQDAPGRDYVSGSINAFNHARKQIPKSGPGAIWIRIPDAPWSRKVEDKFLETEEKMSSQLANDMNRRVNVVVLMTRFFHEIVDGERKGLVYRVARRDIVHKNPRIALGATK